MTTAKRTFLDTLKHPQHLCSHAIWAAWKRLALANAQLFIDNPRGNLSVEGNAMADVFGSYVRECIRGPIIDIGCGPQPHPLYLKGVPGAAITGIDPLINKEPGEGLIIAQDIWKVPAIAERIPLPASVFGTAIAATSLDHLLNINAALAEIHRVLTPSGRLVCWVRYWPGSPIYNPFGAVNAPDPHHLYHLDTWFEELAEAAGFRVAHSVTHTTPKPGTFITFMKV